MSPSLALVSLLVREYDEALAFFTGALGFRIVEDRAREGGRRWLVVAPPCGSGASLLLARAANEEQVRQVGNQAGGRVWLFLETDDFGRDHRAMRERGVHFTEEPREEPYGTVAVFRDLYGNRWDLLQRKDPSGAARPGAAHEEIARLFAARAEALVRGDVAYFRRLLDESFRYTNASGAEFDRDGYLAFYLESGRAKWRSQEWTGLRVERCGDVAIATCVLHDAASFDGVPLDARFRTTQVFANRDGGWRYLAGHTTAVEG